MYERECTSWRGRKEENLKKCRVTPINDIYSFANTAWRIYLIIRCVDGMCKIYQSSLGEKENELDFIGRVIEML